jgi:DnaJ-like protein
VTLDPYRTLGLEPGASSAEVKRAYRRLAKAFHPDSAGESALPRFLAIHEAYEAIRTGRPMGATRAGVRPSDRPGPGAAAEPWRADPARAKAARERARTGRARPGSDAGAAGAGAASRGSPSRGGASQGGSGTAGTRGRRGGTRKATLGSTSYDEARDPADASWSGASWYGPTTGEYWIINPREYADPRKHGPDYQSRARRMAADPSVSGTIEDEPPFVSTPIDESEEEVDHGPGWTGAGSSNRPDAGNQQAFETRAAAADPSRGRTRAQRAARGAPAGQAAHATEPAWDAARIRDARRRQGRYAGSDAAGGLEAPAGAGPAGLGDVAGDALGGVGDDQVRRLGTALVAWPPIGIAAAAAIGDVTGCSSFSAACGDVDTLLPWLAQAGILGLLLLLPALARLLAGGTMAVLIALVPVTAFLVVVGGAGEPEAGFALAFLLGIAWILGVAGSIIAIGRRRDHGAHRSSV